MPEPLVAPVLDLVHRIVTATWACASGLPTGPIDIDIVVLVGQYGTARAVPLGRN